MNTVSNKWFAIAALIAILVLVACIFELGLNLNRDRREIEITWSVIVDYDRSRNALNEMTVYDDAQILQIILRATSNVKNRQLKMIMEREKLRLIRDIIEDLRKKTGKDLGSDPEEWIKKYHRSEFSNQ